MGDLVQRLRLRSARVFGPAIPMEAEAADRIEALEKALREARTKIELYREKYGYEYLGGITVKRLDDIMAELGVQWTPSP